MGPTRENRTITVDFHDETTYFELLGNAKALVEYILANEKHSRCLTDRVYLPTIVRGCVIWHLG